MTNTDLHWAQVTYILPENVPAGEPWHQFPELGVEVATFVGHINDEPKALVAVRRIEAI